MSMNTGENEQGLQKVIDLTRMISVVLLFLHCYFYCYAAFQRWGFTSPIGDRILKNLSQTGLFDSFNKSKETAAAFLLVSLMGFRGRKSEKIKAKPAIFCFVVGIIFYFGSTHNFIWFISPFRQVIIYILIKATGYILILTGGGLLTRIIKVKLSSNVFNTDNQTFPHEERLLKNEYSINLPATYNLKGKKRNS